MITCMMLLCIIAIFLLEGVSPSSGETHKQELGSYSGFYAPDISRTSEDYAGAWLIGLYRYLTLSSLLFSSHLFSLTFRSLSISIFVAHTRRQKSFAAVQPFCIQDYQSRGSHFSCNTSRTLSLMQGFHDT